MRLKNKIAIVTGAKGGIEKSSAFADEGAHLVLFARSPDQLENVASEIRKKRRKVIPVTSDVSSAQEVQDLAKVVQDEFGRINILVNNAGISRRSRLLEYDDEAWLEVIRINLFGNLSMYQGLFADDGANRPGTHHQYRI
jgi:NADP-dependent 3-hydroxy acid dehydrogenase YdfG